MIQKGIISRIDEDILWVAALSEKDEEKSCASGGCGSGCSCNVTGQEFRARNEADMDLKIGDKVEVHAASGDLLKGLAWVFILPVLTALLFNWAGPSLLGRASSLWFPLSGAFLGLASALLFSRKHSSYPRVVKKL